jgi:hypothetical protein
MACKFLLSLASTGYAVQRTLRIYRFRWAVCQIDALEECLTLDLLEVALASLPETLDDTYSRTLNAMPSNHKPYATRILQFLTFSERSMRIEEVVDAIAVNTENEP